jgi:hypothetical protein
MIRVPRGLGIMPRMNRAFASHGPAGLLPLPRPLMTGEMLDASFRLFRAALLRSLPYSGLAVLALQFPALYALFLAPRAAFGAPGRFGSINPLDLVGNRELIFVLAVLFCALLFGVITLRLQAVSRGARPRFRSEIATALRRWPMSLVATLGSLGIPLLLIFAWSTLTMVLPWPALVVIALPLLWPAALLAVALPAFWCDGLGAFAALAQAVRVSRRRSWRMIGAIFATSCVVTVFYALAAVVLLLAAPLMGRADLFLISTIRSLVGVIMGAFGVPFVLAMLVVAYEDLKLRAAERT